MQKLLAHAPLALDRPKYTDPHTKVNALLQVRNKPLFMGTVMGTVLGSVLGTVLCYPFWGLGSVSGWLSLPS